MAYRFAQVDVFTRRATSGNPLAVVADADDWSDADMASFANWTNLSETTFLLAPTNPAADYRVRIFTPSGELPFAGHPTLGSAYVWLDQGGKPNGDEIVQECGVGLVRVRCNGDELAFGAPPLRRDGPVDSATRARVERIVGDGVTDVVWADNGPRWCVAVLESGDDLVDRTFDFGGFNDLFLGVVGPVSAHPTAEYEVRAFFPGPSAMREDPVTGSLHAGIAAVLMARDPGLTHYVAAQGSALGRSGEVTIERDAAGTIWVGGRVAPCITGTVELSPPG